MTNKLKVEQADIDAAQAIAEALEIEQWAAGSGYFAQILRQAFAQHRIQSQAALQGEPK